MPVRLERRVVTLTPQAQAIASLTTTGAPFELIEESVRGSRMRVYVHAPQSLRAVFEASAKFGTRDFLVYQDERCTFEEHAGIVAGLARHLAEAYGVCKGDRVAIGMRNYPEWSYAFWATQVLGAVTVPLNAWATGPDLRDVLTDCRATVMVLDGERAERLAPHMHELDLRAMVVVRGAAAPYGDLAVDDWAAIRSTIDVGAELPDVDIAPDDDATIIYTSGTTGRPKGAIGTHRNHVTNYMNVCLRHAARAKLATPAGQLLDERPRTGALATYPFFHISGLNWLYLNAGFGSTLCLQYKWDLSEALKLIERHHIGSLALVPMLLRELLESPLLGHHDVSSIQSISCGGGPVPRDLVSLVERRLGQHVALTNGYGLTETTSAVVVNSGSDYRARPTSVGRPVASAEIRVVDLDTGDEVCPGDVGELEVRGANVVRGYWDAPDVTAAAFRDGWFRTGDLGRMDTDGYVYIVDRLKDVVIRAGENVYCSEVEAALVEYPGVVDAAVLGVPHSVLGEEVAAIVQIAPGADVTPDDVRRHAAGCLAYFKVPSHIYVQRESLPRTPAGKILKRTLRDQLGINPAV